MNFGDYKWLMRVVVLMGLATNVGHAANPIRTGLKSAAVAL